jgi:putrescine transport system permease protein
MRRGLSGFNILSLVLGLAFLYIPILILILYSFNASRLVTVWGGFSTQWYQRLLSNQPLMESVWISLQLAFISASLATVIGTALALSLTRLAPFRGRNVLAFLGFAPLVMPEIITGLSLLLLFIILGLDRGFWTIVIAHTTFTACFVSVVVQSRLASFDGSLEEAAIDLGATPMRAFLLVTLPIIAPALVAGWLLAFTLSLDDLVIASFTSGPGSTTLPMRIYSQVRLGVTPEINAISTLLVLLVSVTVLALTFATRRRSQTEA